MAVAVRKVVNGVKSPISVPLDYAIKFGAVRTTEMVVWKGRYMKVTDVLTEMALENQGKKPLALPRLV